MNVGKSNSLILCVISFFIVSSIIVFFSESIQAMHTADYGSAYWFASDPGVYYKIFLLRDGSTMTTESLIYSFMVGAPVLMLLLTDGQVSPILIFSCMIFFFSLYSSMKYLERNRILFFFGIILIPYVALGFFALNKEIFVVSSTLFFLAYYKSNNIKYLLYCFFFLFFARYYMLFVFVFCLFIFPPGTGKVRWGFLLLTLFLVSLLSPFVLTGGALMSYSSDAAVGDSGFVSLTFSNLIRNYMYFVAYIPKYIMLILSRFWTIIVSGIHADAKANLLGFLFSLYTILVLILVVFKVHNKKSDSYPYLMMAIFSPLPIMFNDIFHWRYYIFTIPVFIFYLNQRKINNSEKRH